MGIGLKVAFARAIPSNPTIATVSGPVAGPDSRTPKRTPFDAEGEVVGEALGDAAVTEGLSDPVGLASGALAWPHDARIRPASTARDLTWLTCQALFEL